MSPRRSPSRLLPRFFDDLLNAFGPQGWWPTGTLSSSPGRYRPGKTPGSETSMEKLEICVGAVLTQNTAWTNASRALQTLARHRALNFKALSTTSPAKLAGWIRSSGYFRQKAKKLKNLASALSPFGGNVDRWLKGNLLSVRTRLLEISGVGPETADSILLYAGGKLIFVVDAYTRRIAERWGVLPRGAGYDETQKIFQMALTPSVKVFGEFHALLVELAKRHCYKRNPDCPSCPVARTCAAGKIALRKNKRRPHG